MSAKKRLTKMLHNLVSNCRGATTTEYALLLALVVVTLIGTLSALGTVLNDKLGAIIQELGRAGTP